MFSWFEMLPKFYRSRSERLFGLSQTTLVLQRLISDSSVFMSFVFLSTDAVQQEPYGTSSCYLFKFGHSAISVDYTLYIVATSS